VRREAFGFGNSQIGSKNWMEKNGKNGTVAEHRGDYRFISAEVGFVTSSRGIMRTDDGGRQWKPVHGCQMTVEVNGLSRNLTCEFAKLFFLNERIGWAISDAGADRAGFVIARTPGWRRHMRVLRGSSWRRPEGRFFLFYGRESRRTVERREILLYGRRWENVEAVKKICAMARGNGYVVL
jgi:hypothetical protein